MNGEERREQMLSILRSATGPISGIELASKLNVSRQVIVQDIALMRAKDIDVFSTNRGYVLKETTRCTRIFKVIHGEDEVATELETIVDYGGRIKDVFVYHKVYGVIKADMDIRSRKDVKNYMNEIATGKSSLLMKVTSGYHYHTIEADDSETLDQIQEELKRLGFLAKLQEYEPVDFWNKA